MDLNLNHDGQNYLPCARIIASSLIIVGVFVSVTSWKVMGGTFEASRKVSAAWQEKKPHMDTQHLTCQQSVIGQVIFVQIIRCKKVFLEFKRLL